jgi:hypothetical protein
MNKPENTITQRILFKCLPFILTICLCSSGFSQNSSWNQKPDSLLSELVFPARFDSISVLDCYSRHVSIWFGNGYHIEEGGHLGTTFYTDPNKSVILRIEWGVDWHVDEITFSKGEKEDLPPSFTSIGQLPDAAISTHLRASAMLEGKIKLGIPVQKIVQQFGRPAVDTIDEGFHIIVYKTDYTITKDVLDYECWFWFKNNELVRFKVYNGE